MSEEAPTTEQPTPSPEPSLSDTLDSLVDSVEMNEEGELEIQLKSEPEEETDNDGVATSESDTSDGEHDYSGEDDEPAESSPSFASSIEEAEKRYKALQSHKDHQLTEAFGEIQKLRESMARLEGKQEAGTKVDDPPATAGTEDDLLGFGNEDADFARRVATEVDRRVKETLSTTGLNSEVIEEVKIALGERRMALELDEVRQAHEDFDDRVPQIREILARDSDNKLSFSEAYEIAAALYPEVAAPQQEPESPAPQESAAAAQEEESRRLLDKQHRLNLSPQSVRSDQELSREAEINSPKDAIAASFEEAYADS